MQCITRHRKCLLMHCIILYLYFGSLPSPSLVRLINSQLKARVCPMAIQKQEEWKQ